MYNGTVKSPDQFIMRATGNDSSSAFALLFSHSQQMGGDPAFTITTRLGSSLPASFSNFSSTPNTSITGFAGDFTADYKKYFPQPTFSFFNFLNIFFKLLLLGGFWSDGY